jgi:alcohol dehydrogenase class IV
MACCAGYPFIDGGERVFEVDTSRIVYGSGAIEELGAHARALGLRRVALFTDPGVAALEHFALAVRSLRNAGCDAVVYDRVRIEPTNESFADAIGFAREVAADGYISIGGGSSIDTAKAANLYETYPTDFLAYVNAPVGEGRAVPGPLRAHIACPTTAGTGSECTAIAIFDHLPIEAKTGIASRRLRPTLALIDPDWTLTLPPMVVACAGFDVLSHALESYTARPYTHRTVGDPAKRPPSQGANPFSDMACLEALSILRDAFVPAVQGDPDARERMMYAATLAGIGFGNAGVHLPHAMAYAVAGLVRDYRPPSYPQDAPIIPHGMSVIVNAPAVFALTEPAAANRHRLAAARLGASDDESLAACIRTLMRESHMPLSLRELGYTERDVDALVTTTLLQQRLLANAPLAIDRDSAAALFRSSLAS